MSFNIQYLSIWLFSVRDVSPSTIVSHHKVLSGDRHQRSYKRCNSRQSKLLSRLLHRKAYSIWCLRLLWCTRHWTFRLTFADHSVERWLYFLQPRHLGSGMDHRYHSRLTRHFRSKYDHSQIQKLWNISWKKYSK